MTYVRTSDMQPNQVLTLCNGSQHSADVAVIECQPSDVKVWRQRLEDRARTSNSGSLSHKPRTWDELQLLIQRYHALAHLT